MLTDPIIKKRTKPDKWSIHENLAHLGRYQEIFEGRINLIIQENNPEFGRYKAEDDDVFKMWIKKDTHLILKDLFSKREILIQKFENFSQKEFSRMGNHPKLGQMNLIEWLEFFLLHEAHHLYAIFWISKTQ